MAGMRDLAGLCGYCLNQVALAPGHSGLKGLYVELTLVVAGPVVQIPVIAFPIGWVGAHDQFSHTPGCVG